MIESLLTPLPILKKFLSNKVFENFSYLTIGTVVSQTISLVAILKITHVLAPDNYGLFTFLIAQGALLLTVSSLGTTSIFIRTIARDTSRANDLFFNGIILRSAALASFSFLYALYNYYYGNLTGVQLVLVILLTLVSCLYNLVENVFHGNQKMLTPTIINLTYSLTWLTLIHLIPFSSSNVNFLFFIYFLLNAIKTIVSVTFLKYQNLLIGETHNFWMSSKRFLEESWPYFVLILIMLPITSLSNNFLVLNSTINEVGFFNLSQRIIGPMSLVISIVFTAIFPNLSSLWADNEQKFSHLISIGFKYFMLFALIICFLFNLFAQEIVTSIFPKKYTPALMVCRVQVWYLFLTSIDSLIGTILGAIDKEKIILRFGIIYSLFCTPAFFYFSKYGALGLSYAYVISFAVCLIYVWHMFKKTLKIKIEHSNYFWFLATVLFSVSCFIPSDLPLNWKVLLSLSLIAGSALYFSRTYASIIVK